MKKIQKHELSQYCARAWAQINISQAKENMQTIIKTLTPGTKTMAVVKADAYGHGAVILAKAFLAAGADMLAVACLDELLQLREAGIDADTLLLSEGEVDRFSEGIINSAIFSVFSLEQAKALQEQAQALQRKVKVHIKIDTGMGRLGFDGMLPDSIDTIAEIVRLENLEVEGIFTHFSTADGFDRMDDDSHGEAYLKKQFETFLQVIDSLEARDIHFRYRHCCNSAATILHPEMHLDLVRPGLILYGVLPDNCRNLLDVKPLLSLHAKVLQVKDLSEARAISYGRNYVSTRKSRIATVAIGYADGYRRALGNRGLALVKGQIVAQIGTVCMDQIMFDVSNVQDLQPNDDILLIGRNGEEDVSVEDMARIANTIPYEIYTGLSLRVPRVYELEDHSFLVQKKL